MAFTYEQVARRLGRQAVVRLDRKRGTEFRIAPSHRDLHASVDSVAAQPDLEVRYHDTPVVTFHADGTYTLRTGGLPSPTLLRRISEYAPITLTRRGGSVYVQDPRTGDLLHPFFEEMRVDGYGRVIPPAAPVESPPAEGARPLPDGTVTPEQIAALIGQALDARMADYGFRPRVTAPPVRAVSIRALVEPQRTPGASGPDAATMLERVMRANGVKDGNIARVVRDFRQAMNRGRDGGSSAPLPPRERRTKDMQALNTPAILTCPDCGRDMRLHYDGANRLRDCNFVIRGPVRPDRTPKKPRKAPRMSGRARG